MPVEIQMETSGELRGHEACDQSKGSRQGTQQTAGPRREAEGWNPERSGREQVIGDEMEEKAAKCGVLKK